VRGATGVEQLAQVGEVLDVAALVRRDGHPLGVLLDDGAHDALDAAIVAEVDHLAALGLQDPPHDVDRGVMAVEQAGGGDEADGVPWRGVLGHGLSSSGRGAGPSMSMDGK
jgi:hypothetical protein